MVDFERSAQRDNPELVICKQSYFKSLITQLRSVTRELNIVSGQVGCSVDDEDCEVTLPETCNYFNFENIRTLPYETSGSGSGSGSAAPEMEDEEEEGCEREDPFGN